MNETEVFGWKVTKFIKNTNYNFVRKHILRMSDDEIQEIEDQIKDEEGGENGDPDTDGMFATNEPSEGEK